MPIYEYRCKACGKEFEMMQKFSDEPLKKCIYCSGKVEKLISRSSFQLKGSGWHATDYGRKEKPPEKPDGKSGEKSPEKSPEKSDECKDSSKKPECSGCPSAS